MRAGRGVSNYFPGLQSDGSTENPGWQRALRPPTSASFPHPFGMLGADGPLVWPPSCRWDTESPTQGHGLCMSRVMLTHLVLGKYVMGGGKKGGVLEPCPR